MLAHLRRWKGGKESWDNNRTITKEKKERERRDGEKGVKS